jgi:hypothetical protein
MTTLSNMNPMGPITPHGSVVVNVAFDTNVFAMKKNKRDSHWQFRNDSDGIVVKGDLVFRYKDCPKRKRVSYNEPDLKVFSTVNGMPNEKIHDLRNSVTFIGVANNDLVPGPSKHASATVAGMITIRNTGPFSICAGEKIVWDFPDINDKRVGRKTFVTLPYDKARAKQSRRAILEKLQTCIDDGECDDKEIADFVDNIKGLPPMDALERTHDFLDRKTRGDVETRIIGTAMSDAKSNESMDVLIRFGK